MSPNGSSNLLSPQQLASLQQQIGLASQTGDLNLGSHGENAAGATGSIQVPPPPPPPPLTLILASFSFLPKLPY